MIEKVNIPATQKSWGELRALIQEVANQEIVANNNAEILRSRECWQQAPNESPVRF